MNTNPVTHQTLRQSIVAVPPLARNADFSLNRDENLKIVRHIEAGGVTSLLYGGNANFYHVALSEYEQLLELLTDIAGAETTVIPSVGPAYGMMMDQADILAKTDFPTVMILPQQGILTSAGVEQGVRDFVARSGKKVVLYIKYDGYIEPEAVKRLVDDELISVIKYATVREDTGEDPYLSKLVDLVDPKIVMSGIGEQPAIIHLRDFQLGGFTSGCVCVAPYLSAEMLQAILAGNYDRAEEIRKIFVPLEDHRNNINPIRVLHEAVRLAGIADTGPLLPLLNNLEADYHADVETAAKKLLAQNAS